MREFLDPVPSGLDRREVKSYSEADRVVDRFLVLMRHFGIEVAHGSDLDQICETVAEFKYRHEQKLPTASEPRLRIAAAKAFGLSTLLRKIVHLGGHPSFHKLVPHLRKLNTATVPQTIKATDDSSNKTFELLTALLCLEAGDELEVDDPMRSSGGKNPDVLVTLDGRRWGLACKVICGDSPLTLFERIAEGVRQIDVSDAEVGIVMLNLKNAVDLDVAWPVVKTSDGGLRSRAWLDRGAFVVDYMREGISTVRWQELIKSNGAENIVRLFSGSRAIPAALIYVETATCVDVNGYNVPTSLRLLHFWNLSGGPLPHPDVFERLNLALHDRLTPIDGAIS